MSGEGADRITLIGEADHVSSGRGNDQITLGDAGAGSIDAGQVEALIECYRTYRGFAHGRSLQNEAALADGPTFERERGVINGLWKYVMGGEA